MKRSLSFWGALSVGLSASAFAPPAHAHIDMLGALKSRGGDQKSVPCDGARTAGPVYMFEPGATITLGVTEGIDHDSYFRIAFDNDGQDGFKEPASIDPINENRVSAGGYGTARADNKKCLSEAADKCGKSDFCNVVSPTGATVLWDNLDPHLGSASAGTYTWTVQLPNVECENCTLQVLQVMEDTAFGFHGPFDGDQDIYHRCVNITLKKGAGTSGPGNATGAPNNKGMNCLAAGSGGSDAGTSDAGVGPADAGSSGSSDAGTKQDAAPSAATPDAATGTGGSASPTTASPVDAGNTSASVDSSVPTTTAGPAPATAGNPAPSEDGDEGCSVSHGSERPAVGLGMMLLVLGMVTRRRRRQR